MFAQLGNIKFDLITYFNGLDDLQKHTFVEHQTIESKPKLQFIGDELDEINIKLNFHSLFCTPENEIKKLKDTAKKHQELSFILGNGKYIGKYIIEEISSTTQQSDKLGNIISIEAQIRLKEWSENNLKIKKKTKKQTVKVKTSKLNNNQTVKNPKQIVRQA